MFRTAILTIFEKIWPMFLICTMIMVSLRLVYLWVKRKPFVFYEEVLKLGFIIYIMAVFYVVTFQDVSWSTSNFVPLKEIFRYDIGSHLFFKNVLGNMVMFLPYGFFVAYFLKVKKPYWIILLSFLTSLTIEFTQSMIGRVFDVDDILLNVLGGIFGFYLYWFLSYIKNHIPKVLNKTWVYNVVMILFLICLITYFMGIIRNGG